jgi:hypothetical protein
VATWSDDGRKKYAEYGPDGEYDGRNLSRWPEGHIRDTGYYLFERGKQEEYVVVFTPGFFVYNDEQCAPDDPRVLALIALVAPVEVRRAAPAPHLPSAPFRSQAIVRWIGRLLQRLALPSQALAKAVATEVHPHAARRRWWPCNTTQPQPQCPHDHGVTGARTAPFF